MHGSVEEASAVLSDPCSNYLEYGYDNMIKGEGANTTGDGALLKKLCVAMGADRAKNPESPTPNTLRYRFGVWRRELLGGSRAMLERLEEVLGPIDFPNPYPTESGTVTPRGIASVRAVHAIYYASRLKGKVVEIGGGLGRNAYYATHFGVTDYTLVDLPFTAISQGHFLAKVLGPDHGIKLLTPDEFLATNETYDVAFNADGLTEISLEAAQKYAAVIRRCCKTLISINHEANAFTVRELFGKPVSRYPYWLREGYVEERYEF